MLSFKRSLRLFFRDFFVLVYVRLVLSLLLTYCMLGIEGNKAHFSHVYTKTLESRRKREHLALAQCGRWWGRMRRVRVEVSSFTDVIIELGLGLLENEQGSPDSEEMKGIPKRRQSSCTLKTEGSVPLDLWPLKNPPSLEIALLSISV